MRKCEEEKQALLKNFLVVTVLHPVIKVITKIALIHCSTI